ncbi:hypothetical protein [Sandaracinus amylolyticus]|uniref:Tryptophan synthase alpha chain n=1 Tax=Sandaracinus amylolyticus TaxID=927083 RepID=A0A0F6YNI2_9BACT|nr:hypothetical protein [Sandaracinus amylolyticus]AKF10472.1 Tryptophan synthase alpha chain [Sandaracinus amylolyticus]
MRATWIAMIVIAAAGCSVDRGARECAGYGDCAAGEECYRGFCVEGGGIDAGVDAEVDSGPPVTCEETEVLCNTGRDGVCEQGVELACSDGTRPCESLTVQSNESCNGDDDDCNGVVDNGFPLDTEENCGMCGASCADGFDCCPARGGAPGERVCVNLTGGNDEYCGGCNMRCRIEIGERCCPGIGCINVLDSPSNCGACGRVCAAGTTCCDGECVIEDTDPEHCGGCGNECEIGQQCCRGQCDDPESARCGSCTEDCSLTGRSCCSGSCVDTQTDRNACGACGNVCGEGELCCGGDCVPDDAEASCGACGVVCGENQLCCGNRCVDENTANCGTCGTTCEPGESCCGVDGCANLANDPTNCGDCGVVCDVTTPACSNGHCCPAGRTWCDGECVNTQTDGGNCGRCGRTCLLGCTNGRCNLL